MPDKCLDCPAPSADMDGFIVSGPGGAPRSEGSGVSSPEGPFVREAPQTGPFLLKGKVSSSSPLPDVPEPGWAYEAAEAGTYGGVQATVGDLVWCAGVNPVRWAVLQSDSDDSGRDLVSVSASFGCDPSPALSLTSAKASGASSVQTVDMSCLSGMYGALDSLSGSFGCADDVLTAKIDGKDSSGETVSSVDVSPLLNYIGGRIEEVPSGDLEMLPLVDTENPGVEPPFYFCRGLNFINSGDSIYPDADVFSDGALTVSFSASSPVPESFTPIFYYGNPSGGSGLGYAKLDSSTGLPAEFTLETALAGPLVLDEFDFSSNNQLVPTGNTVSLVTERVEGNVPAYRFTLYSGSGETKKILRLYPSCDGGIDLSGLVSPVFDGSEDGLVPAIGAVQNHLLAGDGTWMRPATDAEIDALFVEPEPEPEPGPGPEPEPE